jgi:3-phenylpropionate/trans-cinnamate dioxygenase ferredoxin reductase subunit
VHPVLGLCPESGGGDGESDAQPDAPGYDDAPWLWSDQYQHNIQILGIPQPGSRTIAREDSLYFSLDENGR